MNNEEKILAMLESMSKEINGINSRLDKLETGQEQIREEMNRRFDEVDKRFDELTLAVGDIVTEVGDMMDDKLSALAHELKWTKDATAQNSMDIAALKKRS